jgi:hypothetical protein
MPARAGRGSASRAVVVPHDLLGVHPDATRAPAINAGTMDNSATWVWDDREASPA